MPAPPLSGRVLLAETRAGVVGARVVAWLAEDWSKGGIDEPQTTDANGAFELAGAPRDRSLRIGVAADGLGSVIVSSTPGEGERPREIEIGHGAVLCGTLRDPRGGAVADADVFASERGGDDPLSDPRWDLRRGISDELVEILRVRTRSGADGRYCIRGLSVPTAYVVSARTSEGAIGRSDPIELRTAHARSERDLSVAATGTIVVVPPSLAAVDAWARSQSRVWRDGAWSDVPDTQRARWVPEANGWLLDGVPAGSHRVLFDPTDFVASEQAVDVRPGERVEVHFELDRGVDLSGGLVDRAGNPIAGWVYFDASKGSVSHVRHQQTSTDGRFRLVALPRLPGTLFARAPGFADTDIEGVVPGPENARTLVLPPVSTVVGRWPSGVELASAQVGYQTNEHGGSFGVSMESGFHLDSIPSATPFHVFVRANGHASFVRRDVIVDPGATLDLGEVAFPTPRMLRGVVRDARGARVVGARIRSVDLWSDLETNTDETGGFGFALLPPGPTTIGVEIDDNPRAHVTVDMRALAESIEIVVPDSGRIAANVRNARGEPEPAIPLNLIPIGSDGKSDWRLRVIVRTDSLGRVEVAVEPGRYRLDPHSSTKRAWSKPLSDIVVSSGEAVTLSLVLD